MPIRICPKCARRIVTGGFVASFCPWGCGDLGAEDIEPVKVVEPEPIIGLGGQVQLFEFDDDLFCF